MTFFSRTYPCIPRALLHSPTMYHTLLLIPLIKSAYMSSRDSLCPRLCLSINDDVVFDDTPSRPLSLRLIRYRIQMFIDNTCWYLQLINTSMPFLKALSFLNVALNCLLLVLHILILPAAATNAYPSLFHSQKSSSLPVYTLKGITSTNSINYG